MGGVPLASAAAEVSPAPAKRGRKPGRKAKAKRATGKPLREYVHAVLAATDKGLHIKQIEAKVRAAGYPTTAKSIYNSLIAILKKDFKKVEKGVYAVAAAANAGQKAARAAVAAKLTPKAKTPAKRGTFSQTGDEMILGMVKGGGQTTAQFTKAWTKSGRGGKADNVLSKLVKAGKLKREKLPKGQKGSTYTLA